MRKKLIPLFVVLILIVQSVLAFELVINHKVIPKDAIEPALDKNVFTAKKPGDLTVTSKLPSKSDGFEIETYIEPMKVPIDTMSAQTEMYMVNRYGKLKPLKSNEVNVYYYTNEEYQINIDPPVCSPTAKNAFVQGQYTLSCVWNFIMEPKNQIEIWPPPVIPEPEWFQYGVLDLGNSIFDIVVYQNITEEVTGTVDCNDFGYPNSYVQVINDTSKEILLSTDYVLMNEDPTTQIGIKPVPDQDFIDLSNFTYQFVMTSRENPRPDHCIAGYIGCLGVKDPSSGEPSTKVIEWNYGPSPWWAGYDYEYEEFGDLYETINWTAGGGYAFDKSFWDTIVWMEEAYLTSKYGQEFVDSQYTITNTYLMWRDPEHQGWPDADVILAHDFEIQSGRYEGSTIDYALIHTKINSKDKYGNNYASWRIKVLDQEAYQILTSHFMLRKGGRRNKFVDLAVRMKNK
ncbi:hypothetical protein JW930_04910 [Candidatus Woesearchaeota archaeon]|nr:hypothetical protein [Candidatus Woesearchaeota archaeon]